MSFFNAAINYLADRRHLRQVILGAVGLLILGAAVLFGNQIEKLLNPPGASQAALGGAPPEADRVWDQLPPGMNTARSLEQLVEVKVGSKRYIYALGGLSYDGAKTPAFRLLNEVERLEISTVDGSPVSGVWERDPMQTPSMYSGHAAGKAFQYGNYLYVVAGDVHVPNTADLPAGSYPLLFSTIERLDLTNPATGWQVWAKLTGVNFYPEALVVGSQLNIVGGVYGVPFMAGGTNPWNGWTLREPIYGSDDATKWPTYKNVPTIGSVGTGTSGVAVLQPSGNDATITTGQTTTTGSNDSSGTGTVPPSLDLNPAISNAINNGLGATAPTATNLTIQQFGGGGGTTPDYAKALSKNLLDGTFSTTVGEHYVLNLNGQGSTVSVSTGELGISPNGATVSDYTGQPLVDTWTHGRVGHLGHLRFYIGLGGSYPSVYPIISPVPQGRYGFALMDRGNSQLLVTGGASWFNPAVYPGSSGTYTVTLKRSFWVIEDNLGPFPIQMYPGTVYQYVGNISYGYNWSFGSYSSAGWVGTNDKHQAGASPAPPAGITGTLPATYTLKDASGAAQGRAFFGFGTMAISPTEFDPVVTGGIINATPWVPPQQYGFSDLNLATTARSDRLSANGWTQLPDINLGGAYGGSGGGYNLHVTGLDNRLVVCDGQSSVGKNDEYNNFRVPDYRQSANNDMRMLSGDGWYSMTGFGQSGTNGVPNLLFGAVLDIRTQAIPGGETTVYVYKIGGSTQASSGSAPPQNTTTVQVLGPFTYGTGGKIDWSHSYLEVKSHSAPTSNPAQVRADGYDYATVTLHALDWNGDPALVDDGTAVTLYTDNDDGTHRSFHPAIKKSDRPDWIEIDGRSTSASDWGVDYQDNFVLVDRGNDEDGNAATSLGEARFTISSRVATNPQLHLEIYAVNLKQQLSYHTPLGDTPMIFSADGVPSLDYSTVVADPVKVVADDEDASTVTVTLKDYNQHTISNYRVKLSSSRGDKEHITPAIATTNGQGVATFQVTSATQGQAVIRALCGFDDQMLANKPITLSSTATVQFAAKISSLNPDRAIQGMVLPDGIAAVGLGTHWATGQTTVTMIPPAAISFRWRDAPSGSGIEDVNFVADGRAITRFSVNTAANQSVNLSILAGGGKFVDSGTTTYAVTTDANGGANFSYQSGTAAGLVKIKAQLASGANDELWLIASERVAHPYSIEIYTDTTEFSGTAPQRVRAVVKAYGEIVKDASSIQFRSDDSGTWSSVDYDPDTGIATAMYTRDTQAGPVHLFAYTTYSNSFVAAQVLANKTGAASITFNPPTITDALHLKITNVVIAENAPIGVWTFSAVSPGAGGSTMPEIVQYPFIVDPYDASTGPYLASITPARGLRGETTSITIVGSGTHFFKGTNTHSIVYFDPPTDATGGDASKITVDYSTLQVLSPTRLTVSVAIAEDAVAGAWNVRVTTGNESAIKPGDGDFLVSDESGYVLDIYSNAPNGRLPRDGHAQATITVFLGVLDPLTRQVIPLPNIDVTLSKGTDGGTLTPRDNQGRTIVRTNSAGLANATYKVDAGDTNQFVTITALASPAEGIEVSNFVKILKEVTPYAGFIVSASPNALSLQGEPHIAALSFTGLPAGTQVTFELNDSPKGHIDGNTNPTSTTTRYIADTNRIPETVEFWAWATLQGIGNVRSNTATIEVGLDSSKYKLTSLTAVPDHVRAGSAETSTITAHLTYNNNPVIGWPIEFEVVNGSFGDYVTPPRVNTVNGNAVTTFAPGPLPGNVIIRARAVGLSLIKEVIVSKDVVDQTADPAHSSISATPTHVPVMDNASDTSKYSLVTVLLRNSSGVPLSGRTVTLSSSPAAVIRKGDGTDGNTGTTDSTGRVRFRVGALSAGKRTVSTTVDGHTFSVDIYFEANLIARKLKVIVPFQARDYDNEVLTYLRVENSTSAEDVFINGYYLKNPSPNNELIEFNTATVYLRPGAYYRMWVKGRYHLGRTSDRFIVNSPDLVNPIVINFSRSLGNPPEATGLLIGDLLPNTHKVGGNDVPLPFHDNAVNVVDLPPIYSAWFQNADIPDFLHDFVINTADWLYWFSNYGNGDLGGPPPYDQRL